MTYTETRTLSATALRSLCIKNDWYTCGDNEEYTALFDRLYDQDGCPVILTAQKLSEIAADIMAHSEIEDYTITSVMYELNKACTVTFDENSDPLAEPDSLWLQTTTRRDGRKTSKIINDGKLAAHLAQVFFLRRSGENIDLSREHDRMYNTTAYIITRTDKAGAVTINRFDRI